MTSRRFMSKKGIYKRLKNSFFLISQKMKLEVFNRFLFQTLRGDFLMEVAHFEMLWKWTLISDHSNHLPNFFYCFATYVTSQVFQPKSVNKLYRGRHTFISVNCFFNLGQSRPLFISWPFSHHNSITNWKSVDVVLGIQTRGHRMVGTDGSTELYMVTASTLAIALGFI